MKKHITLLTALFAVFCTGMSSAQEFRLTGMAGYTFQDRLPAYEGDGYIRDAANYGGLLQYMPSEQISLNFLYKYSKQEFDFNSYSYYYNSIQDLPTAVNYFMFGISRYFNGTDEVVAPFGSFYAGWSTFVPEEDYSSFSRFSLGFDLGVSVKITDAIGINMRSELMMPIQGWGTGIYCGTGGGCGASFETATSVTQFAFTGGVEIRIAPKARSADYYTY